MRLRPHVMLHDMGEGVFLVRDGLTGRSLMARGNEAEVLHALDGTKTAREIAADVLGDPAEANEVEDFVEQLAGLCLLDTGLSDEEVRDHQGAALRATWERSVDASVQRMLAWTRTSVPFYRDRFSGFPPTENVPALGALPIMTKADIRANFPSRLLPEGLDLEELEKSRAAEIVATSGTSDERLEVVLDLRRSGYHFSFPGVTEIEGGWTALRMAMFASPVCSGAVCHLGGTPYEQRMRDERVLFFNSSDRVMRLTRPELDDILSDWHRFRPNVLCVDPVYAVGLLRAFQAAGLSPPPIKTIWTAFEYCSVLHRKILEDGFGAPVHTFYGGTDVGGSEAAFLCEKGRYHVREDAYWFDFVRGGQPVATGEIGAIIVTSLRNSVMPVIRYQIGDIGRPLGRTCDCGHDFWISFELEGRLKDLLVGPDDCITTRAVDNLFSGLTWIDYYSLTQHAADEYELLAVRREHGDVGASDEEVWRERAAGLLGGSARIRIRYVREIPPEKSLKFRLTRSAIWSPDNFR